MRKFRDKVLCWLWPDLWYKLNTTFTEEEAKFIDTMANFVATRNGREFKILMDLRMKMNPLRQKFYDKEYAEKIKKEWGM